MKASKAPEQVSLTPEQAEALQARLQSSSLPAEDIKLMGGLISFSLWLQQQLNLAKLSIQRLKRLFGISTEKKKPKKPELDDAQTTIEPQSAANDAQANKKPNNKGTKRDSDKNHGRYGAKDYSGCETVALKHETLQAGANCPDCAEEGAKGKLSSLKPGILIRLQGNPLITGTRYYIEKLRCHLCGKQYTADVPPKIAKQPKYAPSCYSTLAIGHYEMGLPFYRIECWQRFSNVPLADATQWDKMQALSNTVRPVYQVLELTAAEGKLLHYDDTPNKILSHIKDYQTGAATRKGVYTSVVISRHVAYDIYLFYTSQRYAAENIKPLLEQRQTSETLITMSDASSNNIPKAVDETLLARWILCFCLSHGRRKFYEIYDFFEPECQFVLEQISEVYRHDAHCKAQKMDAGARLSYHQQHSAPLMDALRIWLNNKILYKAVEPNSGLGQAINYMLKHWEALTQFLHHPGAPIDNNLSERAIKVMIRYRKNSLFFKTGNGASVGDCIMSIIHTAVRNGINPFDYLNALQNHAADVAAKPEAWLPWCYQQRLQLTDQLAA
ncbi:MAG: IS66 family transposase [Rhizobiales bacterium]|nr:IS66 family transposase [Hyphomicrobiales bacterium]